MTEATKQEPPPDVVGQGNEEDKVLSGRVPSVIESTLIEYGKQLILKSVETSQEFHKTMLQVSATFGTLITTVTPVLVWGDRDAKVPMPEGWLLVVPPLLMLLSSMVFAFGYFPIHQSVRSNMIDDLREARRLVLLWRKRLAGLGMVLFSSALLLLIIVILGLKSG